MRSYTVVPDDDAVDALRDEARECAEDDDSDIAAYSAGVLAALNWLLGETEEHPYEQEEDE